jgi:hypothetical protein
MNTVPVNKLTLETFRPHVKTPFRLLLDDGNVVEVRLAEASQIGGAHDRVPNKNGLVQDVFSLMFDGPEQPVLSQRCYPLEHDQIGRFELFFVPVEKLAGAIRYQVIFNRLIKAA